MNRRVFTAAILRRWKSFEEKNLYLFSFAADQEQRKQYQKDRVERAKERGVVCKIKASYPRWRWCGNLKQ